MHDPGGVVAHLHRRCGTVVGEAVHLGIHETDAVEQWYHAVENRRSVAIGDQETERRGFLSQYLVDVGVFLHHVQRRYAVGFPQLQGGQYALLLLRHALTP